MGSGVVKCLTYQSGFFRRARTYSGPYAKQKADWQHIFNREVFSLFSQLYWKRKKAIINTNYLYSNKDLMSNFIGHKISR